MPRATEPRWAHVALNCADQETTAGFYRRVFGFSTARRVPIPGGEIVFLRLGDVLLELFPSAAASAATATADGSDAPGRVRHLALATDDLDAFLAGLDPAVPISLGPLSFDEVIEGWRAAWLVDPDGMIVEIAQGYRDAATA